MLGRQSLSLVIIFIVSTVFSIIIEFNFSVDLALLGRLSAFLDYAYGGFARMPIVGSSTS
jgi:hypothetical protein